MEQEEDITITGLEEDDDGFEDIIDSTYNPKSEYKKPVLVMEAVKACREARAKEMNKGFWNNKLDRNGNAIKIWVEDERKIFINSVIALECLLAPEIKKKELEFYRLEREKIQKKIDELFDKYSYSFYEFDPKKQGFMKTNNRIIPQIDEEVLVVNPHSPSGLTNVKGGWNNKVHAYYDSLIPLYDEIFKNINILINNLNDFAEVISEY